MTTCTERQESTESSWHKALQDARGSGEWSYLRSEILSKAICLTKSSVTFDFREMLSSARNISVAGKLLWLLIRPFNARILVGPGFGAASLLCATAIAALADGVELDVLMVRDKRKDHNKKKWVEGRKHPAGSPAVFVDDFMEQGSALSLAEQALDEDGHQLDLRAVVLLFDMWQPSGSRQISLSRYPVVALFRRHDIGLSRDAFDAQPPLMKGSFPEFVDRPAWWRFDLNRNIGYRYKSAPVIADGAVFCADDSSRVSRHDLRDGTVRWTYKSIGQPYKGIVQLLQYLESSLVFGCYDGTLTRLDAGTGEVIWRWRQGSSIHATPAIDLERRRVYINTEQWNCGQPHGHLQALDWDTGRQIWTVPHAYWPPGSPFFDAASASVVATCNDQKAICVDVDNGELRWDTRTAGVVRGRPAIAGSNVFVATEDGFIQAIDIRDGSIVWQRRYAKPAGHQFLQLSGDCVLALDGKWHLIAFEQNTGEIRWMSRLRSPGAWMPVTFGRYLVVASRRGHLAVFDAGAQLKIWEGTIGGMLWQPPAIGEGMLAVASNDEGLKVFAINDFYLQ
jgi:outer membrane protein assembly factor BamB/orotate phosphoribosyltransferase